MPLVFLLPLVVMILIGLSGCSPSAQDDPYRKQFLDACNTMVEYQSMTADRRLAFCKCGYDKTMSQLTEEEKPVARFYLLEQAGLDAKSMDLISEPNVDAMLTASKAIGEAVKQCR